MLEEILIVRTPRGTIGKDQCRLPTASRSSTALSIVGRGWRDIAQIDHIQFSNIDPQFHRWRTIQDRKQIAPKRFLPLFPPFRWHLSSMFCRMQILHTLKLLGILTVELEEERIDPLLL